MKHIYEGKTKTVFQLDNGNYLLKFKDDATGENGVFDPGANEVGLSIKGLGKKCLAISAHFFGLIAKEGILTHFVGADIEKAEMTVLPAVKFGKGLEIICRFRAVGSFLRRYGDYVTEGQKLDAFVEITLKDDLRQDPVISKDALAMLNILPAEDYDKLVDLTRKISRIIEKDLAGKGMELFDIKLEFGRINGDLALVDEISGGNMRVFKDGKAVGPVDLAGLVV
jgi:phosphoribosylaminoimidazole-succinocarboxamide synthase